MLSPIISPYFDAEIESGEISVNLLIRYAVEKAEYYNLLDQLYDALYSAHSLIAI
jgi:hypothetical protein